MHQGHQRAAPPAADTFYPTPRLQAVLAGSYQVPTPAGDLLLRADYAWQDKTQFNVINDFNNQGAYGTANARLGAPLAPPDHRLEHPRRAPQRRSRGNLSLEPGALR